MMKVMEPGLLKADLQRSVNIFTGAGFSTLAGSSLSGSLPVGDDLKTMLLEEFKLHDYAALDLPSIYAVLLTDRRDRLRAYLEQIYTVTRYDDKYDALRKLDVDFLYTTNIDDLPFHIFDARPSGSTRVLHDLTTYGAPRRPADVVTFVPLHGNVRHPDADFLFTPGQISSAFASDRETWYVFQRELQSRPTIFLGYGLRDAGVLQALHDGSPRANFNRWILLRKDDAAATALYTSLGFHVLIGSTEDFLEWIDTELSALPKTASSNVRKGHIGQVPLVSEVAQRPIRNYFLGAEPEWSDAYSSQVVRRRINSAVKNSIYSGHHVALVGVPLSGKTSVLKQVAVELAADRNVLYFDRIVGPQADQIIAEHTGSEDGLIIFIDNLIDSRDAIDKIMKSMKVQIVSAEQSLYFDSVSLRSLKGKIDVHSSSELLAHDLQEIISSIPVEIRRWHPDRIEAIEKDSGEVGLFESLRRHVFDEGLTSRFRAKLAEFEAKDPVAFQVYIMACYVSACRTIVSFDMIFSFLPGNKKRYGEVYEVVSRIEGFLVEVDLADDPHQDYFSIRSGGLARIALKECDPRSFGKVFERFHSAVSPRIIVDYPIFRRYAYDNDFARRAYPAVKDGKAFYSRLVKTTENAYDYQHGAIYLSKLKSFTDAFSWIDTALSKSRGRVFSIRNTHARILFEANIDVLRQNLADRTALEGIVESMEVLAECIKNDARRAYHLLRYSDQALQYAAIRVDDKAYEWLCTARDNLKLMVEQATVSQSRESYNLRKYRNLAVEVQIALTGREGGRGPGKG